MRLYAKFIANVVERFVQAFVHTWGTADPHFFDLAFIGSQVAFYKLFIPNLASEAIPTLTNSYGKFEILLTEFAIDFFKCFTHV